MADRCGGVEGAEPQRRLRQGRIRRKRGPLNTAQGRRPRKRCAHSDQSITLPIAEWLHHSKEPTTHHMAAKKHSEGLAFLVDILKTKPSTPYAEAAEAAKKKGLTVWPIMYGKAKLMLGHVKAGSGATKRARGQAKRGPGRPPKAAGVMRRGPGRPRNKSAADANGLDGIVAAVRSRQRELELFRSVARKMHEMIASALS